MVKLVRLGHFYFGMPAGLNDMKLLRLHETIETNNKLHTTLCMTNMCTMLVQRHAPMVMFNSTTNKIKFVSSTVLLCPEHMGGQVATKSVDMNGGGIISCQLLAVLIFVFFSLPPVAHQCTHLP